MSVRWILPLLALTCQVALAASPFVVINDDGAWNWLQDERAVIIGDRLIVASVAMGRLNAARAGNIEISSLDLRSGATSRVTLHREVTDAQRLRWRDDHSCPALLVRPDGRLLAVYSLHGLDATFHYRVSVWPGDPGEWQEERTFILPAGSRVTFPTLIYLRGDNGARGRTLLFFRGLNGRLMPAWAESEDGGETWRNGGALLDLAAKPTPYVKFAGAGDGGVHLAFTDGHRIDFNNGVHHAISLAGRLHRSDGSLVGERGAVTSASQLTGVFRANADSVAMISDLELDARGRPCIAYSVQMNTRPLRPRPIGADHRYRFARWDGREWIDREIAFAGTETHAAPDDDCTGLIAIDPHDVNVAYISTNVDPATGAALISRADGKRHWEIFRGMTRDDGLTWTWQALTQDSTADNLRPIVPRGITTRLSPVIWLRGTMRMPKDSALEVVTLAR